MLCCIPIYYQDTVIYIDLSTRRMPKYATRIYFDNNQENVIGLDLDNHQTSVLFPKPDF